VRYLTLCVGILRHDGVECIRLRLVGSDTNVFQSQWSPPCWSSTYIPVLSRARCNRLLDGQELLQTRQTANARLRRRPTAD